MSTSRLPRVVERAAPRSLLDTLRPYVEGRRGLIALATVAIVAGLALNWNWLVTAGIAPVLLAALPCVAMCALGLCMRHGAGKSRGTEMPSGKAGEGSADEGTSTAARLHPVRNDPAEAPAAPRRG